MQNSMIVCIEFFGEDLTLKIQTFCLTLGSCVIRDSEENCQEKTRIPLYPKQIRTAHVMLHYNSPLFPKGGCQIWIANISIKGNLQKIVREDETTYFCTC